MKDPLADNTAQRSVLALIKFSSDNPKAEDGLVSQQVGKKVKNPTVQTESKAEVSKKQNPTGSGQKSGKGQNDRQTEYSETYTALAQVTDWHDLVRSETDRHTGLKYPQTNHIHNQQKSGVLTKWQEIKQRQGGVRDTCHFKTTEGT